MGKPPRSYILEHRLKAAAQVLKQIDSGSYSLLELAYTVGFNSHSAFSRSFKRVMGKTPTEFKASENVK